MPNRRFWGPHVATQRNRRKEYYHHGRPDSPAPLADTAAQLARAIARACDKRCPMRGGCRCCKAMGEPPREALRGD